MGTYQFTSEGYASNNDDTINGVIRRGEFAIYGLDGNDTFNWLDKMMGREYRDYSGSAERYVAPYLNGGKGDDTYNIDANLLRVVYNERDYIVENSGEGIDTLNVYFTTYGFNGALGPAKGVRLRDNVENMNVNILDEDNFYNLRTTSPPKYNIEGNGLDNIFTTSPTYGNIAEIKILGLDGNDTFYINSKVDKHLLYGGTGNDTYKFDELPPISSIIENYNEGSDWISIQAHLTSTVINLADYNHIENLDFSAGSFLKAIGEAGDNEIIGGDRDDDIDGAAGNDTLRGGAGNDLINGGIGNDTMIGGVGDDTYYVDSLSDVVTEFNGEGNDTVFWQENTVTEFTIGTDISNIENFNALNSTSVINIFGDSNANIITGNSNNNIINGGAGTDTMIGGAGDDTYYVDSLDDIVTELNNEGNDTVYVENEQIQQIDLIGKLDNVENVFLNNSDISEFISNGRIGSMEQDSIFGNEFSNTILGKGGSDFIVGGRGNDEIYGGADNDRIYGGLDNDTLYGDEGNDRILGEYGNDIIFGGLGDDVILGNSGGDRLYGDEGNDRIYAGSANDLVRAGDGNDIVFGGTGNDYLFGDDGGDRIYGESGNDRIFAGALHDLVRAGDGDDIIDGGTGNDQLFGETGSDTFVFDENSGTDIIHDFEDGSDMIDISSLLTSLGYTGSSAVADGYINFVDNGGNVEIYSDATGTGQFDTHFATLNGVNSSILSDADFIMV